VLSDFPSGIIHETRHRPWLLPDRPWIMTQSWHDLLFAHWPVATDVLRDALPPGLDPDLFEARAWLGVIPFHMTNVAPRGVPALPRISAFPELNVRTYVRVDDRPGIYFFSLDAASALAVTVARHLFHLPYYHASIDVAADGEWVTYHSRRREDSGPAELRARYRPTGPVFEARQGTLEYFLTERYCLYTLDDTFHLCRLEVHHLPWALQTAEAMIEENTMADAAGIRLPSMAPLLHFAKRQDTLAWPLARVT
jgi:uncharacterized protein